MTEVTLRFTNKEDAMTALRADDYRDAVLEYRDWLDTSHGLTATPQEMRDKFIKMIHLYDF